MEFRSIPSEILKRHNFSREGRYDRRVTRECRRSRARSPKEGEVSELEFEIELQGGAEGLADTGWPKKGAPNTAR